MPSPNIIFILCDDLGCYGGSAIPTSDFDRLAGESTRFTQCYTSSPICAPSRSVLMAGQHSGHTRIRDNFGLVGGVGEQKRVPLTPGDLTVAELLKRAGYATGITGKWICVSPISQISASVQNGNTRWISSHSATGRVTKKGL